MVRLIVTTVATQLAIFLFRQRYSGQVTSIRKKPSTTGSTTACPRLQKTRKVRRRSAAAAVLSRAPLTLTSRLQQETHSSLVAASAEAQWDAAVSRARGHVVKFQSRPMLFVA